jgi:hypothetical protein
MLIERAKLSRLAACALVCMLSGCGWLHDIRHHDPSEPAAPAPSPADTSVQSTPATSTTATADTSQPAAAASVPAAAQAAADTAASPAATSPASAALSTTGVQPLIPGESDTNTDESPGSLKATHKLDCIGPELASNTYTPADLYPAVGNCLMLGDMPHAVVLAAIAGVYTYFDTLRVADPSSHDAGQILLKRAMANVAKAQAEAFAQTTHNVDDNPQVLGAVCTAIRRIGAPAYFPAYMIEHGKSGFAADNGSVWTADFDPATAWEQALTDYMHCTQQP